MRRDRREFLKKTATVAAIGGVIPYFSWTPRAFANNSANDRPRIGCIGLGDLGTRIDSPQHAGYGDIVAVCDVDSGHAERAKHEPKIGKGKIDAYGDYRRVLQRNDVDVVAVVTPDHWHVKIAIEALQAGKHVFCQKPLTLTLEENQRIRNACKKFGNRVFAVGTQQRAECDGRFLRAVNMVHKGLLGDVKKVTVSLDRGDNGGPFPKIAPPKELDWDAWLGQTPKVDYIANRCHYQFRWWYDYSAGQLTDWGAHHIDIATWALQQDREGMGPVEFECIEAKHGVPFKDGYPTRDDCYSTAAAFHVKCKFAGGIEMTVNDHCPDGILFEGTKGRIFVNRHKIAGKPIEQNWDKDQLGPEDYAHLFKGKPHENHKQNFYRCIREGGLPVSDVFTHVQAMNTCHLCAIAVRLGRTIRWDPKAEKILGDDQAAAFFARQPRKRFEIPVV
jgi:predicted dehydrogenase